MAKSDSIHQPTLFDLGNPVKCCGECGEVKPHASFHRDSAARDRLLWRCKDCQNTASRLIEKRNRANHTVVTSKTCSRCGQHLPIKRFTRDLGTVDGHTARCKACEAAHDKQRHDKRRTDHEAYAAWKKRLAKNELKRKYGLTQAEYDAMVLSQGGVCAICRHPKPSRGSGRSARDKLCVDHCHKSGKVRGLLCRSCNVALGQLKESIETLQAAIDYLRRHA